MRSRDLRACGWHGHVTYAPTEPELAARLRGETALGTTWRCLRCGDWVLGSPASAGPAAQAPVPPRGRALRQLLVLRLLAVERIFRATVLVAAAYGVHRFAGSQTSLQATFGSLLPAARPLAERLGIDLEQTKIIQDAEKALYARQETLTLIAVGLMLFGVLEAVEGVGLWLAKRWAEYLTVVATAAFLPLEISELLRTVTVTRVVAFAVNVAVVAYLVVAKRLFGVRGGRVAYQRELSSQSLLEVEAAGEDAEFRPHAGGRGPGRDPGLPDLAPSRPERPDGS